MTQAQGSSLLYVTKVRGVCPTVADVQKLTKTKLTNPSKPM